jgi:hypothetical protein
MVFVIFDYFFLGGGGKMHAKFLYILNKNFVYLSVFYHFSSRIQLKRNIPINIYVLINC